MMRARLSEALKEAMKAKSERAVSTLRLILAALKDRDIAARGKGNTEGISEDEIVAMLHQMVKQRRESIQLYEQGGRCDLAEQEGEEIAIIQRFMPQQLGEAEVKTAVESLIKEIGAVGIKDMGRTMAALKQRYPGQMDFAKASGIVRQHLA